MKSLLCVTAWLLWLGRKEFGETIVGLPDGVGPWGPHIPAHACLNVREIAEGLDQCLKRIFGTLNMDLSLHLSPVLPSTHALCWVCSGFWWMWNSSMHHCWSVHQGMSWKGRPPSPCFGHFCLLALTGVSQDCKIFPIQHSSQEKVGEMGSMTQGC